METYLTVLRWGNIAIRRLSWSKRYASWTGSVVDTSAAEPNDMIGRAGSEIHKEVKGDLENPQGLSKVQKAKLRAK